MMTEHDVWKAAFGRHLDRGNDAETAAYWANAAVREYRGGPLGGAGQCENELCPGHVGRASDARAAGVGAAAAKQPRFKFGDRVLVTPVNGPPFYATAGGCDENWVHCHISFAGRCEKFPVGWVKHAPEVSHDQC